MKRGLYTKESIFKYIFFVIAIILIITAIVFFVNNYRRNKNNDINNELNDTNASENIIKDISVPVVAFDTFNPLISKNKDVYNLSKLIFDSLIEIDKDYLLEPSLALEWSTTDNLTYIIKLRKDVVFHNESLFTSKDVSFTIDKIKSIDSIYKDNVINIESIEIIDDYNINIKLLSKDAFFMYKLNFPILSEDYFLKENFENSQNNKISRHWSL